MIEQNKVETIKITFPLAKIFSPPKEFPQNY